MLNLDKAIEVARSNNKGLIINKYMETEKSYIFPVITPNGADGSTFYYEVVKDTGDHGVFDYWGEIFDNPEFGKAIETIKEIG